MAGLYLHIPFCVKKCAYCDFVSFPCPERIGEYVEALLTEIRITAEQLPPFSSFDTIFFGGGTPSLLSGSDFFRIMDALRTSFPIAPEAEISLECNPGTVTLEKLSAYHTAGANRLSIGLQSMDAGQLKSIGRIHTPEQFLSTLCLARDCGFQNINADVMHGLPGQTEAQYLNTLKTVADLGIPHISSYALILEEGTPLFSAVRAGTVKLPDSDAVADMEDAGFQYLMERGYQRYEISNFSKAGFICRHNLNYWKNGEYLGFGPAAHSCLRINAVWTRFANVESLDSYLKHLSRGSRPLAETLTLTKKEEMFECVMLGLRLVAGVDTEAFIRRFDLSFYDVYPDAVAELKNRGLALETPGRFALTPRGLDLDNAAIGLFMD